MKKSTLKNKINKPKKNFFVEKLEQENYQFRNEINVNFKTGIKGQAQVKVIEENTAKIMKSGALPVFATPAMVALMEEASCMALKDYLEEGEGTVGIKLDISHIAPTALDDVVIAIATLDKIEGRKLTFIVEAKDTHKVIGKGIHERFIINNEKFMNKLQKN